MSSASHRMITCPYLAWLVGCAVLVLPHCGMAEEGFPTVVTD